MQRTGHGPHESPTADLGVLRTVRGHEGRGGVSDVTVLGLIALLSGSPTSGAARPIDRGLDEALRARAPDLLKTYHVPREGDLTGDWAEHRHAWSARSDFTGDGVADMVAILPKNTSVGFAVVVLVGSTPGFRDVLVLEERQWPAQGFGVAVVAAGRYKTAAGKGYDIPGNDPPEVELTTPAIERYHFESWSGLWYWDRTAQRFRWVQTSD